MKSVSKQKILVVDDNEVMLKVIHKILVKNGFEVFPFQNSEDALIAAHNQHFDLILVDILMPGINGIYFINALHNSALNYNTAVIVCSVVDDDQTAETCFELGAKDFIKKPFTAGDLMVRIKLAIQHRENERYGAAI